jgi:hypothetical protein
LPLPTRRAADGLRGALRLATDATVALADVVEAMHAQISPLPGGPVLQRTAGLTGQVYRAVRGVTRGVGGTAQALLGALSPWLDEPPDATGRAPRAEAMRAALNGVLGDRLAAQGNPLALPMVLRRDDRARPAGDAAGPDVLLLIHGLCMNDLAWQRDGASPARALGRELGFDVLALHYNTGRPVADNGADLAAALQALRTADGAPPRLVLLGHSLGGLVARSALAQGRAAGHDWPAAVTDLLCLGTPHQGAPLERAGHGVDRLLAASPWTAPLARLGGVRSAGITDLRHGRVLADAPGSRARRPATVPLPDGVRCHAFAGVLHEAAVGPVAGALRAGVRERWLGDGLVPLDSALGRHREAARRLSFNGRTWVGEGLGHLALLHDPAVWAAVRPVLEAALSPRRR